MNNEIDDSAWSTGTMKLRYGGQNRALGEFRAILVKVEMYENQPQEEPHPVSIMVKLFDGVEALMSLKTWNLLFRDDEEIWQTDPQNMCLTNHVLCNDKLLLFSGCLSFIKKISDDCKLLEYYEFMIIFDNSEKLRCLLESNEMAYESF
jgi:hypothetical protein